MGYHIEYKKMRQNNLIESKKERQDIFTTTMTHNIERQRNINTNNNMRDL